MLIRRGAGKRASLFRYSSTGWIATPIRGLPALAAAGLLLVLASCSSDVNARISGIYELKADPTPQNVERIRGMLADPDGDVRATALHAMIMVEAPDAAELAVAALQDEHAFVRATAAKLVGDLDDPELSPALVDRLLHDSDSWVRQRSAEALERVGGSAAIDGLAAAMSDPLQNVRLVAVRGIAKHDPAHDTATLSRLVLDDPIWEVRVQAAKALGSTRDREVLPVLRKALEDENEFVRGAAAHSLRALGEDVTEVLPETPGNLLQTGR